MRKGLLLFLLLIALLGPHPAAAEADPGVTETAARLQIEAETRAFREFVATLWPAAAKRRISRRTFDAALGEAVPDPSVILLLERQPEHEFAIWDYLARLVSEARIDNGRLKLASEAALLAEIEARHGVDRHVLVAIWGVESSYGTLLGTRSVFQSLAMLAWKGGRKSDFGRQQLMAALEIAERGDMEAARMIGSWAGAMGHTQFIPTTYLAYAVDHDRDGRRDLVGNHADALASTANYLKASGWRTGDPWGFEVTLPRSVNHSHIAPVERTVADWQGRGVRRPGDLAMPRADLRATLLLPAGTRGPAFLVTQNFRAILRYNNAISYALAVGTLSDRLRGDAGVLAPWPETDRPLKLAERRELQELLLARGFDIGAADGMLGERTVAAIRAWQKSRKLAPDGHAGLRLLGRLRLRTPR